MKKVGTIIAGISLSLLLLVAGAWADISLSGGGGGPALEYATSPNVDINYTSDNATDSYIITSANNKGTMAYGIVSTNSGYFQKTIDVGADCPAADNDTIASMTEFGGGSSD